MEDYFSKFRLVEVQQTFYKVPGLDTALRWRNSAPVDFEFTLKASQLITHPPTSPTYRKAGIKIQPGKEERYGSFKDSDEVRKAWEDTMNFARALNARVIVFQCPASFKETEENINNMRTFFSSIKAPGLAFAWEPRGDWNEQTIKTLCAELGLIHCVDPMVRPPLHGEMQYFRLHGGPDYRHKYSIDELEHLRDMIGNKEAYVLFNNLNMYDDTLAFIRLLAGK